MYYGTEKPESSDYLTKEKIFSIKHQRIINGLKENLEDIGIRVDVSIIDNTTCGIIYDVCPTCLVKLVIRRLNIFLYETGCVNAVSMWPSTLNPSDESKPIAFGRIDEIDKAGSEEKNTK